MTSDIRFDDVEVPANLTPAESRARYKVTDKGREAKKRRRLVETTQSYMSREFIAWDGEGVTNADGSHVYVLLGNSKGLSIHHPNGLGRRHVFDALLQAAANNPNSIHVIYGGSYDFNMWLHGLDRDTVETLYKATVPTQVGEYRVKLRLGKEMFISRGDQSVTVYDVGSFFQCSFVKACDKYLGTEWVGRDRIIAEKANRSSFNYDDIDNIVKYNNDELRNLVDLMSELRSRLDRVGLRPSRWDGPGAIASVLLTREGVKAHKDKDNIPVPVAKAARIAYAGGRFEVLKFGFSPGEVWEYDLNSAYPSAMRFLPSLAGGKWRHVVGDAAGHPYALHRVQWRNAYGRVPGPCFYRRLEGTICYPVNGESWIWSPERRSLMLYGQYDPTFEYEVLETWTFTPATAEMPFVFVEALYNKRRALKKAGDGAEAGLKLALNSLYGKLAQQIGWSTTPKGDVRTPPFHQLEWAGYITSHARAQVLEAALTNMDAIIAFETDAVFSSEPLNVKIGNALGEWSETRFKDLTYIQSGTYFGTSLDGSEVTSKTRGVDLGQLRRDVVEERMVQECATDRKVAVSMTRFNGAGIALSQSFSKWCRWETLVKELTLEPTGKRSHVACWCEGRGEVGIARGDFHSTWCMHYPVGLSAEFPIEWLKDVQQIDALSRMRVEHYEEDW